MVAKIPNKLAILLILFGVGFVLFSVAINLLDNTHILASGLFQFLEFTVGCLFIYSGFMLYLLRDLPVHERWIRSVLPIASAVVCLTAIELLLQLLLPAPLFDTRLPLYPNIKRQIRVNLPDIAPIISYSTNQLGLRGDDLPVKRDDYQTIITVGGSTTHSGVIDDDRTWSALLQANLGSDGQMVWVGNAGIDGHSSYGHQIVMDSVIQELEPDLVVVLVGINDLGIALSERTTYGTFADFRTAPILFRSHLFTFAWQVAHLLTGQVVLTESTQQVFIPEPITTNNQLQVPAVTDDLAQYRSNLNELVDDANTLNVDILFLTQPLLFEDTPQWETIAGNTAWIQDQEYTISAATYGHLMDLYNATLLDVCAERDIPCYDLAAQIPHTQDYFYDFVHFNETGSRRVADEITPIVHELLATH